MSKYALAIVIIAFWLLLPIPFMMMKISGYPVLDQTVIQEVKEPDILYNIAYFGALVKFYFQTLFFVIPGVNFYVARFINFIQLISALLVFLLLRGD